MVILINLSKTEFYKEEYTDKIFLNGTITGMDSNKEYCIKYSALGVNILDNVHNNRLDYTYLTNRTSSNLSDYAAYIPISELVFDNNGVADISVQVNVVDGNCNNINWTEQDSFINILVYNYSTPTFVKDTTLNLLAPQSNVTKGDLIFFEGYLKDTQGNPIYNARINFYHRIIGLDVALRDSATNNLYVYTQSNGSFIAAWEAYSVAVFGRELKLIAKFTGNNEFNSDDSVVRTVNILDKTPADPCFDVTCEDKCIDTDLYTQRCIDGNCIPNLLVEMNSSKCGYEPTLDIKIGEITYEIDKQIGEDEITFNIEVINNSNETIYNYIKLFDNSGKELDKTPNTYKYVTARNTIDIKLTSKGDLLTPWSIENVQGQLINIKLYSSFKALFGYEEVDSIEFDIEKYNEESILTFETDVDEVKTGDFVVFEGDLVDGNDLPIIDAKINIYWQGIPDEILKDTSDEPFDVFTDENGHYSGTWKSYNFTFIGTQNIKLIAKFDGDDIHNKTKSEYKMLEVIRTKIEKSTPKLTIQVSQNEALINEEIKISGVLTNEEGNPLEFGRIWVYATGGILKNFLKDQSNNNLFDDTDGNGVYQINWLTEQMDKDETIELVALFDEDDAYYGTESLPIIITLTDIKEDLEEQEGCFISNPLYPLTSDKPCIISDTQATWIKYGAIGIGGLYALSIVAPIIKGAGKFLEKNSEEK